MNKIKVIYNTYPMAFHTPGGGEIQLLKYKEHLENSEIDVELFNQWNPNFKECDIVHFFSVIGGSVHFCNFVKQLGKPLVISSSLWITEETKHLYPIDEIRHQLSLADKVIANSDLECEQLSQVLDLPREKFVTVYNGVDDIFLEKVSPELFRNKFNIQDKFILNVGNIEPRKNQLKLVEAMKSFPEMKLVLIGHKRDEKYAQEVFDLGGEQVVYIGPIKHTDELLRSAYAACEVFCLPSTLETPGLSALEALAVGCRIVITEEGATREYFSTLVDYVNPEEIESIIEGIHKSLKKTKVENILGYKYLWSNVLLTLKNMYKNIKEK